MSTRDLEDIFPLTPMQQGMLFHTLLSPQAGQYFEQGVWQLSGRLDVLAFRRAWQVVVERHMALRAAFLWEGLDEPVQVIHRSVLVPIICENWMDHPAEEQDRLLQEFLLNDRQQGFCLDQPPLMRFALLQTASEDWTFVWSHHHLLLDGWSQPVLLGEFLSLYQAFRKNEDIELAPVSAYRDYIAWLSRQNKDAAEAAWREELAGFQPPAALRIRSGESQNDSDNPYETRRFSFSNELSAALVDFSRANQITLSTLFQGALGLLLSRYTREEDVVFGSTVSGRPPDLAGSEGIVGLLINTMPVRVQCMAGLPVLDWLRTLQARQIQLRQYEYCSLIDIQGWSEVPRDQALFDTLLVFENYPVDAKALDLVGDLKFSNLSNYARTNYPLTVVVSPGDVIGLEIAFETSRFDADAIERMAGHFQMLLQGMISSAQGSVGQIALLTQVERQLFAEWNQTSAPYPAGSCVHQLFEKMAACQPDSAALMLNDQTLTYAGLNARANQLANYLCEMGVTPGQLVGLCVERGFEMIIGLLGVLKAGGAYIPLDPHYPSDRIAFMLEDSGTNILLTQSHLLSRLPELGPRSICLDRDWDEINRQPSDPPAVEVNPKDLAYIIYTSGSTGRPKGVLAHHRGLVNFVTAFIRDMNLGPQSRMLQFSSFSFDASAAEIFTALLSGGLLVLAEADLLLSLDGLANLIHHAQVNAVTLPPSLLELLDPHDLPELKTVVSVGDVCTPRVAARWAGMCDFFNGYGPTETTIGACWGKVSSAAISPNAAVSIGRPIANMRIYLLDPNLQPVPIGIPGEIHIAGPGVTSGYLNRPELTAERFIQDPYQPGKDACLYRTGDLGRCLPDGRIEFLGRIDNQVKIRGFRIELGEIESALARHPGIRSSAVIVREDRPGEKKLVGYIGPIDPSHPPLAAELTAFLKTRLPVYMLPATFVFLEKLPMLVSGKVDRKALPAPDFEMDLAAGFRPPCTPLEQGLAEIWQQVLNINRVGLSDNFFELGGHSLLAAQMVARARDVFQVELTLGDLFATPALGELASRLAVLLHEKGSNPYPPIQAQPHAHTPLSFAQQRLWFIDQLAPEDVAYNLPLVVRLEGVLDLTAFQRSLNEIARRHEILRTRFQVQAGQPYQDILTQAAVPVQLVDLSEIPPEKLDEQVQKITAKVIAQPFDLAAGPLLRVCLIRRNNKDHVVAAVMHHIISDGWSMGILLREFILLYSAYLRGAEAVLPDLPIQYADYTLWQRNLLQGALLERQLTYWKEQLSGLPPVLNLPTDRPHPALKSSHGETLVFDLPEELHERLKEVCKTEGVTMYMTLLAAFQVLLARYSGQEDIPVGTVVANRNWVEVESLIGFFVNTLVLRANLAGEPGFCEVLERVRKTALEAYANQDVPFETLVEALHPRRDLSHTPLFQAMFVLDPPMVETGEMPGFHLTPVRIQTGSAAFDLTLSMSAAVNGLTGALEYNTDLWDRSSMERLICHFKNLLEAALEDTECSVWELPYLSKDEWQTLLYDWNQTTAPAPIDRCAHQLFEAAADRQPETPALIFEDQVLSYAELNKRANQLAHFLRGQGVGAEMLVGIFTDRSPDCIVGILGVQKAGGTYLPLDPSYPRERLAFMFSDSQVQLILTQAHLLPRLPQGKAKVVCLDADWPKIAVEPTFKPPLNITPENLAYVIYTSGSTGKPKGVQLRHCGLSNLAEAQRKAFDIREGRRVLQFSPYSFDASVWEIFMALANGGTLVLAPQEVLASAPDLVRLLKTARVSHVTLPPSVLQVLPAAELPDLRVIIAAGEACPLELVQRWEHGRRFFNAYGPTETTVCASMYACDEHEPGLPPIGRPLPNSRLYIVDHHFQPVPVGIPGELLVGGVNLARGYLHRPELTAEKFIPDPFDPQPGGKLYRTGDLTRYRPDGEIEFLGRIDQQVKVRGFRIELGEIETTLLAHPEVQQAAVIARSDHGSDQRLAAYLVWKGAASPRTAELRAYLRQTLPEYMLPSAFVFLETLPLSPSGKVDRRALPAPEINHSDQDRPYTPPRTPLETRLVEICGGLLSTERVGIDDNFFELGGHSLLATQFISRVREEYAVEVPLRALFEHPTVAELAQEIERLHKNGEHPPAMVIPRVSRDAYRARQPMTAPTTEKGPKE